MVQTALFLLPASGLFNKGISKLLADRKNQNKVKPGQVEYWFHYASLGEYEMAKPLINHLGNRVGYDKILITFFSQSGLSQIQKTQLGSRCMYVPFDSKKRCLKFLNDYQPKKAIFIRSELWFNLINTGLKLDTKFYLVNAKFGQQHSLFKRWMKPHLNLVKKFENVFCSDQETQQWLQQHGLTNVQYVGDTRMDNVLEAKTLAKPIANIQTFKDNQKLMILGSSWDHEEKLALELVEQIPNLKLVIAPHSLAASRIESILNLFKKFDPVKFSEYSHDTKTNVLILNTMGQLSSAYQYAEFALIGGGFSGALHNIIEPAVYGCHISFGPLTSKFPEATDFTNAGFAHSITNTQHWIDQIRGLMNDEESLNNCASLAKNYVQSSVGAVQKIIETI